MIETFKFSYFKYLSLPLAEQAADESKLREDTFVADHKDQSWESGQLAFLDQKLLEHFLLISKCQSMDVIPKPEQSNTNLGEQCFDVFFLL